MVWRSTCAIVHQESKATTSLGREEKKIPVRIDRVVAMQGSTRNKHDACGVYGYDSQRDPKHVFLINWIGTELLHQDKKYNQHASTCIHMHPHASTRITRQKQDVPKTKIDIDGFFAFAQRIGGGQQASTC